MLGDAARRGTHGHGLNQGQAVGFDGEHAEIAAAGVRHEYVSAVTGDRDGPLRGQTRAASFAAASFCRFPLTCE
jgi:hypothetical protein